MMPSEVTTGDLARALGISERRVATLKAEGRVPSTPSGGINLPELLATLYRENADHRQRIASTGTRQRIQGPLTWEERHPADAMTNVALNAMAFLAPDAVRKAAEEVGISLAVADRLHEVMLTTAAELRAEVAELCGILRDPDGPEPLKRVGACDSSHPVFSGRNQTEGRGAGAEKARRR